MNHFYRFLLPLLAGLLLGAPAWAQATPAPVPAAAKPPSKGEAQALKLFGMLDANGDGRISRTEAEVAIRIKPSLTELFRRTDRNDDGYLTQDEIRAEANRQRVERQARQQREAAPSGAVSPR